MMSGLAQRELPGHRLKLEASSCKQEERGECKLRMRKQEAIIKEAFRRIKTLTGESVLLGIAALWGWIAGACRGYRGSVFWISQILVLWSLFGFGVSDFFVFVCFDCGSRIPRSGFGIL